MSNSSARSPGQRQRFWAVVTTIALIALLVLLNAPQFLLKPGRQGNVVAHIPVKGADKSARPECYLPIRHLSIGPRNGLQNRMVDILFDRSKRAANCPTTYELMVFATVLTHDEAFDVTWRSDLDRKDYRCPLSVDRGVKTRSGHLSFATIDLDRKVAGAAGDTLDCLPRLSFVADTTFVSFDRQIVVFNNNAPYEGGARGVRQDTIEVFSRELLEDVGVRYLTTGPLLTIMLGDHRLASVMGILNIVLASLLGVAAAALFSSRGRAD